MRKELSKFQVAIDFPEVTLYFADITHKFSRLKVINSDSARVIVKFI
jgi:hypothetical protein